jgi:hypothetical protein
MVFEIMEQEVKIVPELLPWAYFFNFFGVAKFSGLPLCDGYVNC